MTRLLLTALAATCLAAPAALAQGTAPMPAPVVIPAPDSGTGMTTRPATTRSPCGKARQVMS